MKISLSNPKNCRDSLDFIVFDWLLLFWLAVDPAPSKTGATHEKAISPPGLYIFLDFLAIWLLISTQFRYPCSSKKDLLKIFVLSSKMNFWVLSKYYWGERLTASIRPLQSACNTKKLWRHEFHDFSRMVTHKVRYFLYQTGKKITVPDMATWIIYLIFRNLSEKIKLKEHTDIFPEW